MIPLTKCKARGKVRIQLMILTLGLLCLAAVACEDPQQPVEDAEVVAFVAVNVLPMDREAVLPEHTVLVEDGRITVVRPSAEVDIPDGAQQVNGTDRYLMPGLAEMHGHGPGRMDAGKLHPGTTGRDCSAGP